MPAAEYLSEDTSAANGAWFAVTADAPVTVTMKGAIDPRSLLRVEVQDDAGDPVEFDALQGWPAEKRARSITAEGTYRLARPEQDSAIGASITPNDAVAEPIEFDGTFAGGEFEVAYDEQVAITGGVPPYTVIASSGLPDGFEFTIDTTNLVLAGTTSEDGDFDISATVQDSLGNTGEFEDSITIAPGE